MSFAIAFAEPSLSSPHTNFSNDTLKISAI
jgi:hypothetical protein